MSATESAAVHWNPPTTPVWHDDATVNGLRYPTRNPVPAWACNSDDLLRTLTDEQRDRMRAIHEAGHAVAVLATGGYVHHAWIHTTRELQTASGQQHVTGRTEACGVSNGRDFVTTMAAGERAEERWLHDTGLWTSDIAVGVEYGAYSDRLEILRLNPGLGFQGGAGDFLIVHQLADQFLAEHWNAVTTVAAVLAQRLHLTGAEIAEFSGLPNGTPSATCPFQPAA
jgi:hypothetical protein